MFEKYRAKQARDLLPWYINGTLSGSERELVERWLEHTPEARREMAEWQALRRTVANQDQDAPSPSLWPRIRSRISPRSPSRGRTMPSWSLGIALTAIVFAMLWGIVQPGVVLRWSVVDVAPSSFRVYRAPVGGGEFELVTEVPARSSDRAYKFVDPWLWPFRSYVYRVEAVGRAGRLVGSQSTLAHPLELLPAQAAILITSLIVGYGVLRLLKRPKGFRTPLRWA